MWFDKSTTVLVIESIIFVKEEILLKFRLLRCPRVVRVTSKDDIGHMYLQLVRSWITHGVLPCFRGHVMMKVPAIKRPSSSQKSPQKTWLIRTFMSFSVTDDLSGCQITQISSCSGLVIAKVMADADQLALYIQ